MGDGSPQPGTLGTLGAGLKPRGLGLALTWNRPGTGNTPRQRIEDVAAKRAGTKARFFNSSEIRAAIMSGANMPRSDLVIDVTLVFSTKKQRTWVASSLHDVYCVLDDEDSRQRDHVVQWREPLSHKAHVAIRHGAKGSGVFDINQRRNWLYSTDLHPNDDVLKQMLKRLASPNDLA